MEDIEASFFAKHWKNVQVQSPVFITSLPRAGTTILLEGLAQDPALASYTYRDMPFVYSPVLWNRMSSGFHLSRKKSERAHGDGVLINEDSPEAFEEVVWRDLTSQVYEAESIALLFGINRATASAIQTQIKKIVYLHQREQGACRYLSKNNANISRMPVLRQLFPDASILVPFRNAFEHAYSMWQQHLRFSEMHQADSFVLSYMRDLGHFEFGALHKPIKFPGLDEIKSAYSTSTFNYWLAYWLNAFEYLVAQSEPMFLSYETLCVSGQNGIRRLREKLSLTADPTLEKSMADLLREPSSRDHLQGEVDPDLAEKAHAINEILGARCILAS